MANPNTYPSDGRITSLQSYTAALAGGELFPVVAPGNATAGINYNITATALASSLLPLVPAQNPNTVLAGPASGIATAAPAFRALVPLDLPGLVRNAVASSYTVATTDLNKLVGLGGNPGTGAPFTLSLSTASNYTTGFVAVIYNESVSRGWAIAPNGLATFILWPLQTVQLSNDNNVWRLSPTVQPWVVPSGTQFNVDNVNGSDSSSNDGLSSGGGSGAFATIQHAFSVIQKSVFRNGAGVLIQLPAVTATAITESLSVFGAMPEGLNTISIVGNPSTATLCQWVNSVAPNASVDDYQSVTFNGIGFSGNGHSFVLSSQFAIADLVNCNLGTNGSGINFQASQQARMNILPGCSINGGCAVFIQATDNASVGLASAISVSGTANVGIFANPQSNALIDVTGLSFTGSTNSLSGQQFLAQDGGVIVGNSGVSWPSNMTAGTTASGGISDAGLTNSALAQMNASTLKGNNTNTTGGPFDLTVAQVQAMLMPSLVYSVVSNVNLNQTATDVATIPTGVLPAGMTRFQVNQIVVSGASGGVSTAVIGVYTGAGQTGATIATTQALSITTGADATVNNSEALTILNSSSESYTQAGQPNLFVHQVTPVGTTATASFTAILRPLP
jgi:hypothetical protein